MHNIMAHTSLIQFQKKTSNGEVQHGDPYKKENKFKLCHNEVFKEKRKLNKLLCVFVQRLTRNMNENVIMIILES
jgi:hypothetical protein